MSLLLQRGLVLYLVTAIFKLTGSAPIIQSKPHVESNKIHYDKYTPQTKYEEPKLQIVFGYPETFPKNTEGQRNLQSRIQFPENEPKFQDEFSSRLLLSPQETALEQNSWRYDIISDSDTRPSSTISAEPEKSVVVNRKYNVSPPSNKLTPEDKHYEYYWLKQWMDNNIEISDELKAKLSEIDTKIGQEALRSAYLTLFQTPNLRKKTWECPPGKRRDHFGRCVEPFNV